MVKRIVFLGNNALAVRVLGFIKTQPQQLVGLVIHPRNKAKHRQELVHIANLPHNCVFRGDTINTASTVALIRKLKPDILVSVLFGYILKRDMLTGVPHGAVNLHPAYLPYNRGAHPNVWSMVEDTPAGVTLHMIDEKVDAGKILTQKRVKILPTDTGKALYQRLENEAYNLFVATWPKLVADKIKARKQKRGGTFHLAKDLKQLDEIKLNKKYTGKQLINILRARTFPPYKSSYFRLGNKKIYIRIRLSEEKS